MAGMLGLGTSGASGLSQANIEKLKASETQAKVGPIERNLKNIKTETESMNQIKTKINDLFGSTKSFDLANLSSNPFEKVNINTEGTSAKFTISEDATTYPKGHIEVDIKQLATKDIYQTKLINEKDIDNKIVDFGFDKPVLKTTDNSINDAVEQKKYNKAMEVFNENIATLKEKYKLHPELEPKVIITSGDQTHEFSMFYNTTYKQLIEQINAIDGLDASLAKVTDDSYRIIIKGNGIGAKSSLTISQQNVDLGLDSKNSHISVGKNLIANIDGVEYKYSSNEIDLGNGLIINAQSKGKSSANIQRDDSEIMPAVSDFVSKYNSFVQTLQTTLRDSKSQVKDRSALRDIFAKVKNTLMENYGPKKDLNVFTMGFELKKDGSLSVNSATFSKNLREHYSDIKHMMMGDLKTMDEGLGTRLSNVLDNLDGHNGPLDLYDTNMRKRTKRLEDDKKETTKHIEGKYKDLAAKYASYTDVISRMETSFKGFQNMARG